MSVLSLAGTGLQTIMSVKDKLSNLNNNVSVIDLAKPAQVQPVVILDAACVNLEMIGDVLNTVHSIFASYYLQAFQLMGTSIDGITVGAKLAQFNPSMLSFESYQYKLPTTHTNLSLESKKETNEFRDNNLAIGKIYKVTIKVDAKEVDIPVAIRLMPTIVSSAYIADIATFKNSTDMSLSERWHAVKSGRLSFIKDFILCNDLIDKHRNKLIKDGDNVYSTMLAKELDQASNNVKQLLLTGNSTPKYGVISNIAIIDIDTAAAMENKIHGKLKNPKTREMIFDNTNLMMLVVIDPEWERMTFYYRNMIESSNVSTKDLKQVNKQDNAFDILKSFLSGSAPSL